MKLGMTGTRDGMTVLQRNTFNIHIENAFDCGLKEWHHGDCVGADAETHFIVSCFKSIDIIIHPPIDEKLRAFCLGAKEHWPAKSHFARNRDIVVTTDGLIVLPKQMTHQSFGGTWYTHDYAVKIGKPIFIIWPDGTTSNAL